MEQALARHPTPRGDGCLLFEDPRGHTWHVGAGEPVARIRVKDRATYWAIVLDPDMNLGRTYMEGEWEPAGGSLADVLEVAVRVAEARRRRQGWLGAMAGSLRERLGEFNSPLSSRRNVHHHYDLDFRLYESFLDRDLHYSCAYFREVDATLEAAQQSKCALIGEKLDLHPGARVLDIGSGWGSLAMALAEKHDVEVVGITLSPEQRAVAQRRAEARGLGHRVTFRVEDYRDTPGTFDAVVSVGMFEHVGRPQYRRYFERVQELLKPDGTALIHFIGRSSPPGTTNRWIRRYIFPGGYIPAASEVLRAIEPSGLILTDLEVWRLHYARTLAEWSRRFRARRSLIAQRMGERFCRMWEFYLHASAASFRFGGLVVFQVQLARELERLPLTRRYLKAA
ncbi:MAG TPA: cyclopropane-fatty-acyl-phospholipid synthase family protein [Nevskiaceae bacterium]|nr:cyclopropane-fatty-acyl-phospholipid synthase family protein [Nevskiaceae bacterium]